MSRLVIVLLTVINSTLACAQVFIFPPNDTLCLGEGIQLSASTTCQGSAVYTWYVNGDSILSNGSGTYSLIPTQASNQLMVICRCNENGVLQVDTAQTSLTVLSPSIYAGPDQYVDSGTVVTLQATGILDSVLWSPTYEVNYPTLFSVQTSPSATTTYMVQGFYAGCQVFDYVTVYLTNVFNIPNTFSPNDDGTNDTWIIPGIENYPTNRMIIMNRFGDVLYESNSYSVINAWSGVRNGNVLPDGVYYYLLDLGNGSIKKGTISIIR